MEEGADAPAAYSPETMAKLYLRRTEASDVLQLQRFCTRACICRGGWGSGGQREGV